MTEFTELWPGGPRYAQAEHFPLGTDSVLLAEFGPLAGAKRGVDLGCGGGVLTLLLLARSDKLTMTGLEILPAAAKRAEETLRENGLEDRGRVVCGDIRGVRALFEAGAFDLVVANPPFFPLGSGALPRDPERPRGRRRAVRSTSSAPRRPGSAARAGASVWCTGRSVSARSLSR